MNYEEAKQLQTELSAMYETGAYNEKNDLTEDYLENVWVYTDMTSCVLEVTFFTKDNDNFSITIFSDTCEEWIKDYIRTAKQLLTGAITWEQGSELIEGVEA